MQETMDAKIVPFSCFVIHETQSVRRRLQALKDWFFDLEVPFWIFAGVVAPFNVGVTRMLYHRTFNVSDSWKSLPNADVIMLHIDKVDWEAEVWVNGVNMGLHRGG